MSGAVLSQDAAALDRALARYDAYRSLAAAFRDPGDPAGGADFDAEALRSALEDLGLSPPQSGSPALERLTSRDARAAEHRAIFGHVVAHGCPPYETEYGRRHLFGQSQELGDIRGFYEAFGVRPRRGGERPDHVACELEFLALLALKEATSMVTGEEERAAVARDAAGRFLADHAARWLPALAARIGRSHPDGGYALVASMAAALATAHARELGRAPVSLGPDDLVPVTEEPDGFAFECGLDAESGDLLPPGSTP